LNGELGEAKSFRLVYLEIFPELVTEKETRKNGEVRRARDKKERASKNDWIPPLAKLFDFGEMRKQIPERGERPLFSEKKL